jgi:hypothetical protein
MSKIEQQLASDSMMSKEMQSNANATLTTATALLNTSSSAHLRLLNQLFLQTTTCQIITGFFAWAALLITVHHVIIILLGYKCLIFNIEAFY